MAVQQRRHGADVGEDARDVRRGREAPETQRTIRRGQQGRLERGEVHVPVGVLGDGDHVGQALAPRQLVRVVLEGTDEHDGAFVGRHARRPPVTHVELARDAEPEDLDHPIDRRGRPRTTEEDRVFLGRGADRVPDDGTGVLPEAGGLPPGPGRLRVGVGVPREHEVADGVLDEAQRTTRGGVVGVDHAPRPVGTVDDLVLADDRPAHELEGLELGGAGPLEPTDPCHRPLHARPSARRRAATLPSDGWSSSAERHGRARLRGCRTAGWP